MQTHSAAGTSAAAATNPSNFITCEHIYAITDGFSDEREIGRGGFGVVYRGKLLGEDVAVKKANNYITDEQFEKELKAVTGVKHENIVEFVGHCKGYIKSSSVSTDGHVVYICVRALCFKYMENGSLKNHVADESLDWHSRYEIIKGICAGLNHLHSKNIVHRDLTLGNILLDGAKKPKLTDFGLSRSMDTEKTFQMTSKIVGTLGFMPPEFYSGEQPGQYSKAFDIYSLGTVIYHILKSDRSSLKKASEYWEQTLMMEDDFKRVKACIALVSICCEHDRSKRPTIERVIDTLNYTDFSLAGQRHSQSTDAMLGKSRLEGGGGGNKYDISMAVAPPPHRLESVWIRDGAAIDSLMFSYTDRDGILHTEGSWGEDAWKKIFQLKPYEFLVEVSGTKGYYRELPTKIITSLTFVTNVNIYGPYGEVNGDPFKLEAPSKSCIVGFFARAGTFLDAIGVYYRTI